MLPEINVIFGEAAALPPTKAMPLEPQRIIRPPRGFEEGNRASQVGAWVVELNPSSVICPGTAIDESSVMKYARFSKPSTAKE